MVRWLVDIELCLTDTVGTEGEVGLDTLIGVVDEGERSGHPVGELCGERG